MNKIKYIVNIISSKRDLNGNCYHLAHIGCTETGAWLSGTVDAPSNVSHYLSEAAAVCFGQNEMATSESSVPIREFNRLSKQLKRIDRDAVQAFVTQARSKTMGINHENL